MRQVVADGRALGGIKQAKIRASEIETRDIPTREMLEATFEAAYFRVAPYCASFEMFSRPLIAGCAGLR